MAHKAKNFEHLVGSVKGLSEKQLRAHFGLYNGYVAKLNEIEDKLRSVDRKAANYSFGEFSELKRREAVAFNGTYLHEKYFENLNGKKTEPAPELVKAIEDAFGSWDNWVADVKATAASTPGWVLLTYNRRDGKVHDYVMYEHHIGLPVDQEVLMALDCWEHAFMVDYSTDKGSYLNTFFDNVDWEVVSKRYARAKALYE